MTLRHLKIFVTVCETGSVTVAAEKLYIAQPSVSLAIAELETYYGIKLFDRISRRLHITEVGKHFLEYATHVVTLFAEMEQEVKNFDHQGIIRIGTSITIGNYLLPKYAKIFKAMHPHMTLQISIDNSDAIEQAVLSNQIDLGLIEGPIHNPYILYEHFMNDQLILICPPKHPLIQKLNPCMHDLQSEDFILREKGSAGREIFDAACMSLGIEIHPIWQSISTQAIIRAVNAGFGLSVLPYRLVEDNIKRGEVSPLFITDMNLHRQFSIIYHKNKFLTQTAKDFIKLCK